MITCEFYQNINTEVLVPCVLKHIHRQLSNVSKPLKTASIGYNEKETRWESSDHFLTTKIQFLFSAQAHQREES